MGRSTNGAHRIRHIARVLLTLAVLTTAATSSLAGQYFGRNRIQYRDFDFSVIETEHFDVYYYDDFRAAAMDAARMAERAYGRLARLLNHRYRERQPIVLFASHSEFQQNNLIDIGEGTQGVTDPLRHRVMLPFTGSYEDFDHVLQHELVHQFQFDIFARGQVGAGVPQLMAVQPPLWFMEGLAEYLSLGAVNPLTAMWLRDAAREGTLPTIEELSTNPRIFPYRYGHALFAFIGDRWGDDAVADLLHAVAASGVNAGFRRALRISLAELTADWHRAVQERFGPDRSAPTQPHTAAQPVLTRARSGGGLHVSPALSPGGGEIAYFSEGGGSSIDLYLADVESGRITRRLAKGAFSAEFESLRFISSTGAWSRDGRYFAFPTKRGGRDDLVIYDVIRDRVARRLDLPVAGITNPTWSPTGLTIAFTGLAEGVSNLYAVNIDGSGFARLTDGPAAALHPAWSPDGRTIAFATDGGTDAAFGDLRPGRLRIALYRLDTGEVDWLPDMAGHNINPHWSPDGDAVAFVSDRTGTANVFLYDRTDDGVYQITDVATGISGITDRSPAISWAPGADRLAFTSYENGEYVVYAIDAPRSHQRVRWLDPVIAATTDATRRPDTTSRHARQPAVTARPPTLDALLRQNGNRSFYRSEDGFRLSAHTPAKQPRERPTISVRALLDSAAVSLPDPATFGHRRYHPTLRIDYVAQPTLGYQRDNFGSGFFGGSAISLSDLLGNRRLFLGGQVNGRLEEAQVLAVYANTARRTNWSVGYQQAPTFFYQGADLSVDLESGESFLNQRVQRFVMHRAFFEAARPFSRFERLETQVSLVNVSNAELNFKTAYDPISGLGIRRDIHKTGLGSVNYAQPSVALVFDNAAFGLMGPIVGRRSRFEYAPAFGDWRFQQALGDYRRYDRLPGPFTLATRSFFFGRFGRDSDRFPVFLGSTDLVRGYTSGSFRSRECAVGDGLQFAADCDDLTQLIGSRIAVVNAELRFPIVGVRRLETLPVGFPPLEGAIFFDAGVAWRQGNQLALRRSADVDFARVRAPLASWGASLRGLFLGFIVLRGDFTKPLSRLDDGAYFTLSLGPSY